MGIVPKGYIINAGSVDDIQTSLKHRKLSIKQLQAEINAERQRKNRTTVIMMLQAAIRKQQPAAKKKAVQKLKIKRAPLKQLNLF